MKKLLSGLSIATMAALVVVIPRQGGAGRSKPVPVRYICSDYQRDPLLYSCCLRDPDHRLSHRDEKRCREAAATTSTGPATTTSGGESPNLKCLDTYSDQLAIVACCITGKLADPLNPTPTEACCCIKHESELLQDENGEGVAQCLTDPAAEGCPTPS